MLPGSEKMSGRGTMISRTEIFSRSMARLIISSCSAGTSPNLRLAVTISFNSSGECTPPSRNSCVPKVRSTNRAADRITASTGLRQRDEYFHRRGHGERHLFGALQGDRLRNDFTQWLRGRT